MKNATALLKREAGTAAPAARSRQATHQTRALPGAPSRASFCTCRRACRIAPLPSPAAAFVAASPLGGAPQYRLDNLKHGGGATSAWHVGVTRRRANGRQANSGKKKYVNCQW